MIMNFYQSQLLCQMSNIMKDLPIQEAVKSSVEEVHGVNINPVSIDEQSYEGSSSGIKCKLEVYSVGISAIKLK